MDAGSMNLEKTEKRSSFSLPTRRFAYPSQAVFLSQAALLEEVGPPKIQTFACFLGFALVSVALVTAALVKIDVMSSSSGNLVSSTPNHEVQSFDGGIVEAIHVREGQVVSKDELLIALKDPEAEAQLNRLQARQASLAAQAERLQQLAKIEPLKQNVAAPDLALLKNQQLAILPIEEAAAASEVALAQAEINRRIGSAKNLNALKKTASAKLNLAQEKLATQRHLHEKKLVSTADLREAEQELVSAEQDLAEIEGQVVENKATIIEAERRLEDLIASRRQRQGDKLSSIMVELSELQQQILTIENRLDRAVFKAPIQGIIQSLDASFAGRVIAPGEKLLEIIPIDDELIADARLPTTEIRHVMKGQDVRLSVDGIEPHRDGYLEGEVQHLSPSTFIDENGVPYYQTLIALDSNELAGVRLIPGMTVQAQIKTGQRTILEYLLKPVYRAWSTAFQER
jgi:HlyD family secretion protein/adhesin transport system membrane fusion protein